MRTCESLSRRQRQLTPLPFCRYLVDRIGAEKVAVLWVHRTSHYYRLWPRVEIWGLGRDANKYAGPYPVICHPPCGPWGKYKANCKHRKEDGIRAMELVHRWGGIVEHPVGSSLFAEYGRGGTVEKVNQGDFGHYAKKPTLLYIVHSPA